MLCQVRNLNFVLCKLKKVNKSPDDSNCTFQWLDRGNKSHSFVDQSVDRGWNSWTWTLNRTDLLPVAGLVDASNQHIADEMITKSLRDLECQGSSHAAEGKSMD